MVAEHDADRRLKAPNLETARLDWSKALGEAPVYIHGADRQWVCRECNVVLWEGDTVEALPGRMLVKNAEISAAVQVTLKRQTASTGVFGVVYHERSARRDYLSMRHPEVATER